MLLVDEWIFVFVIFLTYFVKYINKKDDQTAGNGFIFRMMTNNTSQTDSGVKIFLNIEATIDHIEEKMMPRLLRVNSSI